MKPPITFEQLPEAVSMILAKLEKIEQQLQVNDDTKTTFNPEQVLNVKQAAAFLDLSVSTVYCMVSKGLIPYSKKAKRIYFFHNDLTEYIKTGKRKTLSEIAAETHQYVSIKKAG